jgi:hypothetical protein
MQASLLVCPHGVKVGFDRKRQFRKLSPPQIIARAFQRRRHHHLNLILRKRGLAAYVAAINTGDITTIPGAAKRNPGTVASFTSTTSDGWTGPRASSAIPFPLFRRSHDQAVATTIGRPSREKPH